MPPKSWKNDSRIQQEGIERTETIQNSKHPDPNPKRIPRAKIEKCKPQRAMLFELIGEER
jgi:hypothetical protein